VFTLPFYQKIVLVFGSSLFIGKNKMKQNNFIAKDKIAEAFPELTFSEVNYLSSHLPDSIIQKLMLSQARSKLLASAIRDLLDKYDI
jgi:hypothetical protein